jgi:glycosyltransferase involved in cell wall biosynthesis
MSAGPIIPAAPAPAETAWCEPTAGLELRQRGVVLACADRYQGNTGVEAHARTLIQGLQDVGIPIQSITPDDAGKAWWPIWAVRPLLLKWINHNWSTRWYRHWHGAALRSALKRLLTRRPPAVVVCQCPLSSAAALELRTTLGLRYPIATVCHFNYSEASEFRQQGLLSDPWAYDRIEAMERQVLAAVDHVIYVSHWAQQQVEAQRGIRPRASSVILNGVAPRPRMPPLLRRDLGLSDSDVVLINVGTIEPRKNQLGLVRLFAALAARCPAAKLLLVGDGPQRAAVAATARQLGVGPKVHFLGFRSDVPALLPLADVYIHYATVENCPVALIEAARAGLPVAATAVGGVGEMLRLMDGAVSLKPDDVEAGAAAMAPLLSDAALRQRVGQRCRQAFEQHLTQQAMVLAYLKVFCDVTGRPM